MEKVQTQNIFLHIERIYFLRKRENICFLGFVKKFALHIWNVKTFCTIKYHITMRQLSLILDSTMF